MQWIDLGDGYFYGVTGQLEGTRAGAIFRFAPGKNLEVLHRFLPAKSFKPNSGGASPYGPLLAGPDGSLYGLTLEGGANGMGTVYRYSPDGLFAVLKDIDSGERQAESLAIAPTGELYGTIRFGGARNGGTLFQINTRGVYRPFYEFAATGFDPHNPEAVAISTGGIIVVRCGYAGFSSIYQRVNSFGISPVSTSIPMDFDKPYKDGFLTLYAGSVVKYLPTGGHSTLYSYTSFGNGFRIVIGTPDGVYGTTTFPNSNLNDALVFGENRTGSVIHEFSAAYQRRDLTFMHGKDGNLYGLAAFHTTAPVKESFGEKLEPEASLPRVFRVKKGGVTTANLWPVAAPDVAWLPVKAKDGQREVLVDLLKNDGDPDGDPLSITELEEPTGNTTASIITDSKGRRLLRFTTAEEDPASRMLKYTISDSQGGQSIGVVCIKSPVIGRFSGLPSSEDLGAAPLALSIASKNRISATLTLDGVQYTGRGTLNVHDEAHLTLTAKKQTAVNLQLKVKREVIRQIEASFDRAGAVSVGTCLPVTGKK